MFRAFVRFLPMPGHRAQQGTSKTCYALVFVWPSSGVHLVFNWIDLVDVIVGLRAILDPSCWSVSRVCRGNRAARRRIAHAELSLGRIGGWKKNTQSGGSKSIQGRAGGRMHHRRVVESGLSQSQPLERRWAKVLGASRESAPPRCCWRSIGGGRPEATRCPQRGSAEVAKQCEQHRFPSIRQIAFAKIGDHNNKCGIRRKQNLWRLAELLQPAPLGNFPRRGFFPNLSESCRIP